MKNSRIKAKELAQKALVVFVVSFAFFFGVPIWEDSYKNEVSKRTAIAFFCIKCFFDDLYKKMNVAESPLDTLTLKHLDNEYTIKQLVAMAILGKQTVRIVIRKSAQKA